MNMRVEIVRKKGDLNIKDLMVFAEQLAMKQVTIGIHKEDGAKTVVHTLGRNKPNVCKLIDVACYNEFGDTSGNHPPQRAFVKVKEDEKFINKLKKETKQSIEECYQKKLKGSKSKMTRAIYDKIGEMYLDKITDRIQNSLAYYKSNALKTIDIKGFDYPLFEEGYLFKNLKYKTKNREN